MIEPVTVLVPTLGRADLLRVCLASLAHADPRPAEVLLVDQSGTGVAAAAAREAGLDARIVERPPGLAAALNAGLRAARHDGVLVTHDDCRVASDWVGVGARLLREHPGDLHTGRVLPEEGAGDVPSTITAMEPAFYRGPPRADILYPNCMALSSGRALELGGFDERFVAAAEDNDFCFRWMRAGRGVRYTPDLTVWHGDWRTPEQLRALYRGYWVAHGEFVGTHLRRRDRRILPVLWGDVRWAARGTLRRAIRRSAAPDATYAALTRLPLGIARGWRSTHAEQPGQRRG